MKVFILLVAYLHIQSTQSCATKCSSNGAAVGVGKYYTGCRIRIAQCEVCQAGKYRDENSHEESSCKDCPNGKIAPNTGQFSDCDFCSTGTEFANADSNCNDCPDGKYQNQNDAAPATCQNCPAGKKYSSRSQCNDCDHGKYQSQNTQTSATCSYCAAGKYFVQTSSDCSDCDTGKYQEQNDFGSAVCKFCAAGKEYVSTTQVCSDCDLGKYQTSNTAISALCETTCIAKTDADAWSALGCAVAGTQAGTKITALGAVTPVAGYASCAITCPTDGQAFTVVAVACTPIANAATVQCTTTSDETISTCNSGYYGTIGDDACVACPTGSFTETPTQAGATTCTPCTAITNTNTINCTTASDETIITCNPEYYGAVGDTACILCPGGSLTDTGALPGATTCTPCATGKYQTQLLCSNCVNGKYVNQVGAVICIDCPIGYSAAGVAASICVMSESAVTEKLATLNGGSVEDLTSAELQEAADLRDGYLASFLIGSSTNTSTGEIDVAASEAALNTVDSLVGEPSQVSPAAAATASNFVSNVLGSGTPTTISPEVLEKAGKVMDSLVASMSLSGASNENGTTAVKMSANQAADVGLSLANSVASLSALGATEVGGKPIAEFKTNLLNSFLDVVKTAKPEANLVKMTITKKEIKVAQQISVVMPASAAGLDAQFNAANPGASTISPPNVDAIRAGLAKSLNVDVSQIIIKELSTVTARRRRRRMNDKEEFSSSSSSRRLATTSLLVDYEVLVTVEVDETGNPTSEGFNVKKLNDLENKLQLISEGQVTTTDRTGSTDSNSNRIAIPDLGLVVEAVANVAGVSDNDITVNAGEYTRDATAGVSTGEVDIPCEDTSDGK